MAYFDLGSYTRKVTTAVPDAQIWFDRGLNWLYGFNHAEAIACFKKVLELDPACAIAYWGISYAAGPNYNLPWHLYDPAGKAAALVMSCGGLRTGEVIVPLEKSIGVPVVASTPHGLWHCARMLGVNAKIAGFGMVMAA